VITTDASFAGVPGAETIHINIDEEVERVALGGMLSRIRSAFSLGYCKFVVASDRHFHVKLRRECSTLCRYFHRGDMA
jgi:hypothetical protein